MTTAEAIGIDEGMVDAETIETVRAARSGDSAAFEKIMLMTERRVAQIAWRILGDAEEVKDAMQETFLRIFRYLGRYDERKDLTAWSSRIAVNVCLDHLRNRRRRPFEALGEHAESAASSEAAADVEMIRRSERELLGRAIDTLAPKERMAVILRDVEGLPTTEVAAALGSTVGTVRVQLSRARVKLRRVIESWRGGKA